MGADMDVTVVVLTDVVLERLAAPALSVGETGLPVAVPVPPVDR